MSVTNAVAQSINVIECIEFRHLLLFLRETLQNKDIPHRTTMRKAIMEEFQRYYKALVVDLKVQFSVLCRCQTI